MKKRSSESTELKSMEEIEFESPTDTLTRYMSSMGFSLKEPRNRGALEYVKLYSDVSGRLCRVIAAIETDAIASAPEKIQNYFVTIQLSLRADAVDSSCPAFCREDLMRINAYFANEPEREVSTSECSVCGAIASEYVTVDGEITCADCRERLSN